MPRKRGDYRTEPARQPDYQKLYRRLYDFEGRYEDTLTMLLARIKRLEDALSDSKLDRPGAGSHRVCNVSATPPGLWKNDDT